MLEGRDGADGRRACPCTLSQSYCEPTLRCGGLVCSDPLLRCHVPCRCILAYAMNWCVACKVWGAVLDIVCGCGAMSQR